jgi:hypothetical protein
VRRTILAAVLYVVSVLSFAYLVYPHIPEQKAGGNYSTARRVCLRLVNSTPAGECPKDLLPEITDGASHYLIIEEDSNWVYLANDGGPNGPRAWRWPRFGKEPVRPSVYAVNRSCIASITVMPGTPHAACTTPTECTDK